MDVHPTKNGINRYWSIPIWYFYSLYAGYWCHNFQLNSWQVDDFPKRSRADDWRSKCSAMLEARMMRRPNWETMICWRRLIWVWINTYYVIPFLGGWTSIYQLFWCSPGVQGLTHYHISLRNHGKIMGKWWNINSYPLVNVYTTMENHHLFYIFHG